MTLSLDHKAKKVSPSKGGTPLQRNVGVTSFKARRTKVKGGKKGKTRESTQQVSRGVSNGVRLNLKTKRKNCVGLEYLNRAKHKTRACYKKAP